MTPIERADYAEQLLRQCGYKDACAKLGMSPGAMRALFKRTGKKSPTAYLQEDSIPVDIDLSELQERVFFMPDTHRPYHDKRAVKVALKAARSFFAPVPPERRRLVVLGDYADFYQVSDHQKDPRKRMTFAEEVADVNDGLDELDELRADHKMFIEGNHEWRWQRYLMGRAPEILGLPNTSVPELFHLKERGWSFTPFMSHDRIGKIYVTHCYNSSQCGPTAHLKARDQFNHCVAMGHTHTLGCGYQGNPVGEQHVGTVFGWLGDLETIDYMSRASASRWTHGFGTGFHELDTGVVHLQGTPIIDNRTCLFGEILS